jgi:hypothetical protein
MSKSRDYVFVLWGDRFDEAAATIFITELREAGLRVKVVGLTPRQIGGVHGLALVPDLTLDQGLTLASQAICVVIPTTVQWSERFNNDPRIAKFIAHVSSNQTRFVVGMGDETMITGLKLPASVEENIMIYPEAEDLVKFAREMAKLLSGEVSRGHKKN